MEGDKTSVLLLVLLALADSIDTVDPQVLLSGLKTLWHLFYNTPVVLIISSGLFLLPLLLSCLEFSGAQCWVLDCFVLYALLHFQISQPALGPVHCTLPHFQISQPALGPVLCTLPHFQISQPVLGLSLIHI